MCIQREIAKTATNRRPKLPNFNGETDDVFGKRKHKWLNNESCCTYCRHLIEARTHFCLLSQPKTSFPLMRNSNYCYHFDGTCHVHLSVYRLKMIAWKCEIFINNVFFMGIFLFWISFVEHRYSQKLLLYSCVWNVFFFYRNQLRVTLWTNREKEPYKWFKQPNTFYGCAAFS